MFYMRRLLPAFAFVAAFGLATVASMGSAATQTYPSRPITMVVPLAPGGSTDVIARIMAEGMRPILGQPVIVDNTAGAGGTIGVGRLARATPDGYTFGIGQWGTNVANGAVYNLQFDLLKDFEPVALIATQPFLVVSRKTMPANNLKELIAWMKANPDKTTMGTVGPGSPPHVAGIALQNLTDTRFRFVPYRGTAPALQDMIAGQIDLVIDSPVHSLPQARAGKIKAYAVLGQDRYPSAPDIPTTDDAGLPGFHLTVWNALWAVKGTPKDIINRLNAAAVEALADPAVAQRLTGMGFAITSRDQQTPEALAAHHKAEIAKWSAIVKAAGVKAE